MDIRYNIINPTGNITILVETPVAIKDQPQVGKLIMEKEPVCEQVGFLSPGGPEEDIRLRMAGGEFCGNAAMSAAVLFASKNKLPDKEKRQVTVRVSGLRETVSVLIERSGDVFTGCVDMPAPESIKTEEFHCKDQTYTLPVVEFPGISHIICEDAMPAAAAEDAVKQWAREKRCDAMGIMNISADLRSLKPLLYVPEADTLVWESSCASGTSAAGAWFAFRDKKDCCFEFGEPGGVLTIDAGADGSLKLTGRVEIQAISCTAKFVGFR